MWRQGPIWEPKDSSFRPYSIITLICFYIGKFLWAVVPKACVGTVHGS